MSWQKRMREIAQRNPGAIPAWARHSGSVKVWDRAEWQLQNQSDLTPEVAARPILFVLRWLAPRGELSQRGLSAISEFTRNPAAAVLDASMTSGKAARFLNAHYEEWHATEAINALIDPNVELDPSTLEARWGAFGRARRK